MMSWQTTSSDALQGSRRPGRRSRRSGLPTAVLSGFFAAALLVAPAAVSAGDLRLAQTDAGEAAPDQPEAAPDQPEAAPDQPEAGQSEGAQSGEPEAAPQEGEAAPAQAPQPETGQGAPAQAPAAEQPPQAESGASPAEPPAAENPATPSQPALVEGLPGYPPILRSPDDMPEPVRKTWMALRDAALAGDIEALRPLIEAQPDPPTFAFAEIDDPIVYLKSLSGDPEGREILAILLEVLDSGFVLADEGTPEAMYLWPYFTRYPLETLSARQMVEMFTLLTAGDYQEMLSYGAYIFFRVGISPDGVWHFFVAGD